MTPDFLSKLDGTGRAPRDTQRKVLEELAEKWNEYQCFAITAPTGSGKSLISRAIQLATDGAYITASNVLLKQYADYYNLPRFHAADLYSSAGQYDAAKMMTLDPENHVGYNPVSFRNAAKQKMFRKPSVILADEADQMLGLLHALAATTIKLPSAVYKRKNWTVPANAAELVLETVVERRIRAQEQENKGKKMDARRSLAKAERLEDLAQALLNEPERYALWVEEKWAKFGPVRTLHIQPTFLPRTTARQFFGEAKIILLSATLMPSDVMELTGGVPFHTIESESPIPVDRRKVYFMPCAESLSYPIDYRALAAKLDEVLEGIPLRPALVHATYRDAEELAKYLKTPVLLHDKEDKQEKIDEWIQNGGVMLGSGCSTGLDLHGDLCRLNVISKITFPSLNSDLTQKRLALPGGRRSYNLTAIRELLQACGRSTRNEDDFSVTVVLDGRFAKLYREMREEIPVFIKSAVVWESKTYTQIMEEARKYLCIDSSVLNFPKERSLWDEER